MTGAKSAGVFDVVVTSPEGSVFTLSSAYTYVASGSSADVCDNPGTWGASFASGGGGSVGDPYYICTATHLQNIGLNTTNLAKFYKMGDNIQLTGQWTPIADRLAACSGGGGYSGPNLNGDSMIISGLSLTAARDCVGLFGNPILKGVTVTDLGLPNVVLSGQAKVGTLFPHLWGVGTNTFTNVWSTGSVTGSGGYVGGLIGYAQKGNVIVSGSWSKAVVTGTDRVGGLIGQAVELEVNHLSITNSFFAGTVNQAPTGAGRVFWAFRCGVANLTIASSYNTGNITASGSYVGGLLGRSQSSTGTHAVSNSYSTGAISGTSYVGGLIGLVGVGTLTMSSSYSTGNITGSNSFVGGLIGNSQGAATLTDSYATGNVTNTVTDTGGIIGKGTSVTLTNVYATDNINGAAKTGGIFGGSDFGGTYTFTDCYTGAVSGTIQIGGIVGYITRAC